MAPVYVETLPTSILPLPKRPGKGIINTIKMCIRDSTMPVLSKGYLGGVRKT